MTDTGPRFGVAHPTVVPVNHPQRRDSDDRNGATRSDATGDP